MTTSSGNGGIDDLRPMDVPQSCHQSLELSPEEIGRAIEHSSVMVIITDAGGQIEYVNPCFSAITGYRLEHIAGKSPRILIERTRCRGRGVRSRRARLIG